MAEPAMDADAASLSLRGMRVAVPPAPDDFELKFAVPAPSRLGLESALKRGRVRVENIRAIYFDTPEGCLGSHGVAIHLRRQGREWVQSAHAVTADPFRRLEHDVEVRAPSSGNEPRLDLSLHDEMPVGKALRRAMEACCSGDPSPVLSEQFRTNVQRITRTVRVDGSLVALSFERGTIDAGTRSVPVSDFELELVAGEAVSLIALARLWADRHGLSLNTDSKAERGRRLARGHLFGAPVRATVASESANTDAFSFLRATIQRCLVQVLGNASAIGAGALDEELIHQLRVGLFHLRTVLHELGAHRYGADPAWLLVLRGVFRELGLHRDREVAMPNVLAGLFKDGCSPLSLPVGLPAIRSARDVARDPALQQTLLAILAFLHSPPLGPKAERPRPASAIVVVADRLDKLHRLIAHDIGRFRDLSPARQHRVRRRLGRMTSIIAAAESMFDQKRVERYVAKLIKARAVLGESNDLNNTREALRSGSLQGPGAAFATHWLRHRRRQRVKDGRRALQKAINRRVFWMR